MLFHATSPAPRPTSTPRVKKTRAKNIAAKRVQITPVIPEEMAAEINAARDALGCKSQGAFLEMFWREHRELFAAYAKRRATSAQPDLLEACKEKGALPRER